MPKRVDASTALVGSDGGADRRFIRTTAIELAMSTTVRIVKTPDVLHGKPRVEGTRIGVFKLGVMAREQDYSIGEILDEHPSLDREQAEAALAYYDEHPELMETLRAQKRARGAAISEHSRAE
jgi:uncharacterized protein (DUF433 family)